MKIIFLLLFLYTQYLFAGTIDPNTPDSKYIEYGKKFNYIGMICGEYENGELFCGSAVAIDDFNILTAAHVVNNARNCFLTLNDTSVFCMQKIIIHKDFAPEKYGSNDIAVCHSNTPFKLKFYPQLYTDNDEQSKLCCIAGYGFTGTFESGSIRHDAFKRAGSNIIDNISKDLLLCSPSRRTEPQFTSLEFLIATGDSGGGLFIDGKLAGINSCIIAIKKKPVSKYDESAGHTRISTFIEWIQDNKKKKEQD